MTLVHGLVGVLLALASPAAEPEKPLDPDVICLVNGEPLRTGDLEQALFLDDYQLVVKNVIPFLVQEIAVRQTISEKGVTVKAADVQAYMEDLDQQFRRYDKRTLRDFLKTSGMDEDFFRRKLETTLGLYQLAGGKQRAVEGMREPAVQARMNALLERMVAQAKVETDLGKLPEGTAAVVNGQKISVGEVARVARISLSDDYRKRRLGQLQRYFVVRQELRRRKLEFTKDDIEYQVGLASGAKATKLGEADFPMDKILEKLGSDLDLLRQQYGFRRVAMLSKMVKDQVAEDDLRKLFEADPPSFGDGVPKASHIQVRILDDKDQPLPARELRRAKERAEAVHKRVVAGEDFAKLAGELSEDKRTADLGGSLGYQDAALRESDIVVRTAYGLKAGEVSRPVLSKTGWHVIKVTEVHRAAFKDARPLVLAAAVRARRNDLEQRLVKDAVVSPGPAMF